MCARILDAVSSFVGEFAEVHFGGMRRKCQHIDVGTRTENAGFSAGQNDARHFRMLKSNPLKSIVQLDIHAEIVRIQFELVARADASVFLHIQRQRRDTTFERQFPVAVAEGSCLELDNL